MDQRPKLFYLERTADQVGLTGTGKVAEGIVYSDGRVSMRWLGERASTVNHDSIDNVEYIHCHNGNSKIVYYESFSIPFDKVIDKNKDQIADSLYEYCQELKENNNMDLTTFNEKKCDKLLEYIKQNSNPKYIRATALHQERLMSLVEIKNGNKYNIVRDIIRRKNDIKKYTWIVDYLNFIQ